MSDDKNQMRGTLAGEGAATPAFRISRQKLQKTLGSGEMLEILRMNEPVKHPADVEPGDWRAGMRPIPTKLSADLEEQIPHGNRETPIAVEEAALTKFMEGGGTLTAVEQVYGLRKGFLGMALRRRYGDVSMLKKALVGQSLENSLILQEYAIANITELSPAQALLGAKITADTAVAIEKSAREAPKSIDFGALAELGGALAAIEGLLRGDDASEKGEGRQDGLLIQPTDPNPVTQF